LRILTALLRIWASRENKRSAPLGTKAPDKISTAIYVIAAL